MSETEPSSSDSEFDHVVDDATPRNEAETWAIEQLHAGRPFDDVLVELTAGGWSQENAEQILEFARQMTRNERGVVTRDQVAAATNAYYRSGYGGIMFAGLPSIAAVRRLLYSFATLKFLKKKRP